jgi:GNAT superfamily N-acetyltransferase
MGVVGDETERMRTGGELTIRAGTPADLEGILALLKASLGEGQIPRDRTYWEWKHHRNPFGESPTLLALADGQIVGLRAFMRWEWSANGERIRAVRAVDTATHPDWQGKGIFSRLTRALIESVRDEGVHLIFNTPNEKSRPGYLKLGWQQVGRTDLMLRMRRPLRIAAAVAPRTRNRADPAGSQHAETTTLPRAREVLESDSSLNGFLERTTAGDRDRRLHVVTNPEYLRWRYSDVPGFQYHAVADVEGESGAAMIFRFKRQGSLRELRLCDFIVGPGARSRALARGILSRVQQSGEADYLSVMSARGAAEYGLLLRSGFLPAPRFGPILTTLPLNSLPGGVDPLRRANWRPSIGDLELF